MTLKLGETGFNSDMISNSLKVIRQEIQSLISAFSYNESPIVLEEYGEDSSWLRYVKS